MTQVLIVDDDEPIRKLFAVILGDMDGFAVAGFCPTFGDVQTIASDPRIFIDMAIVDGQFPLHEGGRIANDAGRQTAEYLRRVRPGVKILACSGNEEDSLDWADKAIHKPFTIDTLEAALIALASTTQPEPS